MRFNFKKISAVLTSAVMLGSSLGIAAAANYPDPFIKGGVADVAIVYGTGEGVSVLDAVQAGNVQTDLQSKMSTTSSSSTASVSGENVKIEKSSTKLNVGDNLTTVWSASITNTDLPTLLASGTYTNYENTEYAYTQRIALGTGLQFTQFASSQYKDSTPTIGFDIAASRPVLNYTLDWTTNPESDVVSGDLDDIEKTSIPILGKTYYILDLDNATLDMTLLDSAVSEIVKEGEKTSMKVGDKTYEVSIEYVGTATTRIKVGDETTSSLSNGGTYKLKDGTYIGIRDIMYTAKTGDVSKVELSLGKGKLELKNNANVKLNEANVRDLYGRVIRGTAGSGGKEKLERINIEWIQYEEGFFTPNTELVMPGFGNLKFTMGNLTYYANEKTSVEYGSDSYFNLKATIKDGALTIPLVYGSTTTGNFTGMGQDSTRRLATGNNTKYLVYQAQASYNEGFIATWNNSREGQSYYLKAAVNQDGTTGVNKTTISNKLTNKDICTDLEAGQSCTIGNVVLNVDDVTYLSATAKNATFHLDDGGSFNRIITTEGLSIWLPYATEGLNSTNYGAVNFNSNGTEAADVFHSNTGSIGLWFAEEDKDETLGAGQKFNMTLDMTGTAGSSMKTSVTDIDYAYVAGSSSDGKPTTAETIRTPNSGIWETVLLSELATKILWNKPSGATQYSADIYYHGQEVYGDVFLAAPAASVTSGSSGTSTVSQLGNVLVKDSEIESVKTKNLVVIGGSCINSVAAKALGVSTHTCGAAFTEKTKIGTGQFLIQSVADAYTTGKIALVVAGYDAADTQSAATALTKQTIDTTAGKKYTGTSGTEAVTLVTTA
ncbi:MAG: hypothetical protein Q7R52_00295 [archaeon]|nr:hypothetical protein [archaeon]